jgi:hypothetical protein
LVTVDADGWPHIALLSLGEVLSISESRMRLGLWPNTTTTANLTRFGRGLLMHVAEGAAYYVRLAGPAHRRHQVRRGQLVAFELEAVGVTVDQVGYADLLPGVTYRLKRPSQILERWRAPLDRIRLVKFASAERLPAPMSVGR